MPSNNTDNLIPFNERSKKEARELGRKGGIKSGESRRAKKTAKELCELMLESTLTGEDCDFFKGKYNAVKSGKDINVMASMIAGQIEASIKGNPKAFENILALIGQGIYEPKEESDEAYKNMVALADLINRPRPNRNIEDFESDE